jgi:RNA polymerase sigma-70 factor, ECF subfamily
MAPRPTPRLVRLNPGAGQGSEPRPDRDGVVHIEPGAGGRLSLEEAFRRHSAAVASVGFRILGSRAEAEDLVQDVFLRARRWLDRIEEPAALRGWLTVVAVREARYRLRVRRLRAVFRADDTPSYVEVADSSASPATRTLLAEVYRVLDAVTIEGRLAWTLRHVEGMTLPEVAQHCGCSLATAKRRISSVHQTILEALG